MSEAKLLFSNIAIILAASAFMSIILAVATMKWWLLASLYPILFVLFVSRFLIREPVLSVQRTLDRELVLEGEDVEVKIRVHNAGPTLNLVLVSDFVPEGLELLEGNPSHLMSLKHGETREFRYRVETKRGMWAFENVQVDVMDPLGLFTWKQVIPVKNYLTALPEVTWIKRVELRAIRTRPTPGHVPSKMIGEGMDFHGLREYVPGDAMRKINWKATARHARLISNEYEAEKRADVIIVVDSREVNALGGRVNALDYSARVAASIAHYVLQVGNRVGLISLGGVPRWVHPDHGSKHFLRIAYALSSLRPRGKEPFDFLIRNFVNVYLTPGAQIIIITPFLDESVAKGVKILRRSGFRVIVVSPSPISIESQIVEGGKEVSLASKILELERNTLMRKMAEDAEVYDWDIKRPLKAILGGMKIG
ncbi:MAG: hypothetical protein DRN92_05615 [Thermoproteota archaeon]|nr:MAG: hypothetical protein DRN92_05615 [Candidatus Korarchaeota archaeon]